MGCDKQVSVQRRFGVSDLSGLLHYDTILGEKIEDFKAEILVKI